MLRETKLGMIFSGVFHVTLITVSIVGVPALMRSAPSVPEAIPVEIVEIDDVIRFREAAKQAEAEDEVEVKVAETKPQAAPQQPSPPVDAVPMPDAKPQKKPKQEPTEEAVSFPKVAPRAKPTPPKRLDTSRLAALIDQSLKEDEEEQKRREEEERRLRIEEAVSSSQETRIASLTATATYEAVLQRAMDRCWSVPAGAKDVAAMRVGIRVYLTPDGALVRPPQVVSQEKPSGSDEGFYRAFTESVLRAIRRCAPYTELPKERYNEWGKGITMNFDTSDMLGN